MNKRLLSLLVAISVFTTATLSGGFPVFAGNEELPILDVVESLEESILDTVDELLSQNDATASDAAEEIVGDTDIENDAGGEAPEDVTIETGDKSTAPADIQLTATAEDGTVVVLGADGDAFPYENLELVVHVVTGEAAEEASEEIDAEKPAENTAKRVTYDVQVQSNGTEVQPVEGKKVSVSFRVADAPSGADEVTVYHHDEQDGGLEEIASADITEDSAVVDVTETGAQVSAEVTANASGTSNAAVTKGTVNTSSDEEDEYYEDYELENDLVVTGETDSFSLYTVDFTYDEKTINVDGDTDHNELAQILETIGITDEIADAIACMDEDCTQPAPNNTVTLEGRDLFRVYNEEGTWYMDAINAFGTTHGLLVKTTTDAEYKVTVTDKHQLYEVHAVKGVTIDVNGTVVSSVAYRSGSWTQNVENKAGDQNIRPLSFKYMYGTSKTDAITARPQEGYTLKEGWSWNDRGYSEGYLLSIKPTRIMVDVYIAQGAHGKASFTGKTTAGMSGPIDTKNPTLTLEECDKVITTTPDDYYKFDKWVTSDGATKVTSGQTITATFAKDATKCKKITVDTDGSGYGTVSPATVLVGKENQITGSKPGDLAHSATLTVDGDSFSAVANDGCYFTEWTTVPSNAITEGKVTEDTIFTAHFVDLDDTKTITFEDAVGCEYIKKGFTGNSVDIPENARFIVDGDTIRLADGSVTITAKTGDKYQFIDWLDDAGKEVRGAFYVHKDMRVHAENHITIDQKVVVQGGDGGVISIDDYTGGSYQTTMDTTYGVEIKQNDSKQLEISEYPGINTKTITAIPDYGYKFADPLWTGIPSGLDFETATVVANFVKDSDKSFKVTAKVGEGESERGLVTPDNTEVLVRKDENQEYATIIGSYSDDLVHSPTLVIDGELFKAEPKPGCYFIGWSSDDENAALTTGKITKDTILTARFVDTNNPQTITLVDSEGGSYAKPFEGSSVKVPKGATLKVEGDTIKLADGSVQIQAVPDTDKGYKFINWVDLSGKLLSGTSKVNEDMNIKALYSKNQSITVNATRGGQVKYDGGGDPKSTHIIEVDAIGGVTFSTVGIDTIKLTYKDSKGADKVINVQAIPDSKCKLTADPWSGLPSTATSENVTITANFEKDPSQSYKITATASNASGTVTPEIKDVLVRTDKGDITGSYEGDLVHSATLTIDGESFTAEANENCYFIGWESDPASALTDKKVTANTTFTAKFVDIGNPKTVTLKQTVGGVYETTFEGDSVQVPTGATVAMDGETIKLAGGNILIKNAPNATYVFNAWKWFDAAGESIDQPTEVSEDMSVQAEYFLKNPGQNVNINATTGGKLVGDTESTSISLALNTKYGTLIEKSPAELKISYVDKTSGVKQTKTIQAVPETGYKLTDDPWSGIPDSIDFATADITANFEKDPEKCKVITATTCNAAYGTVTPIVTNELVRIGQSITGSATDKTLTIDGVTFTANEEVDKMFVGWTSEPASALADGKVTEDTVFTANFVDPVNKVTVTVVDTIGGKYTKTGFSGNSVELPGGATLKVTGADGDTIALADGSITVVAEGDPAASYKFVGWFDGDGKKLTGTSKINKDMSIRAVFNLKHDQSIAVKTSKGGMLEYRGVTAEGFNIELKTLYGTPVMQDAMYPKHLVITYSDRQGNLKQEDVYAEPEDGYLFSKWDGIPQSVDFERATITAKFEKNPDKSYKVTLATDHAEWGSVSSSSILVRKSEGSITGSNPDNLVRSETITIDGDSFSAIPEDGCYFTGWTSVPADALTNGVITADTTFTAHFVNGNDLKTVTIVDNIGGSYIKTGFTADSIDVPEEATLRVDGKMVFLADGSIKVEAVPDAGYAFVNWVDGDNNVLTGTSKVYKDMNIMAMYRTETAQSVTINAVKGGNLVYRGETKKTVILNMPSLKVTNVAVDASIPDRLLITYYDSDGIKTTESVDAVAETGYKLADTLWTGIPTDVSISDINITANFTASNVDVSFDVDAEVAAGAKIVYAGSTITSLSIPAGKNIEQYGSSIRIGGDNKLITATNTNADYVFDHWEITPDEKRIEAGAAFTAYFVYVGAADAVTVTTAVDDSTLGAVVPAGDIGVKKTSKIEGQSKNNVVKIGSETFTAIAAEGMYFDHWTLSGSASWGNPLIEDMTLTACFVNLTGSGHAISFDTPENGTYQNSFVGDSVTVPASGTSLTVDGDRIVLGDGQIYAIAIADSGYGFAGWYNKTTGKMLEDDTYPISDPATLVATFEYGREPVINVEEKKPEYRPTSGGGGGGFPGQADATNYHSEHTYGSMEAPINDGEWELLANNSWKYNWRIPMVSAWGCIVNPYAHTEAGQTPHGWFFFDPYGIMLTGWKLVDGKWYYLEPISNGCRGQLYVNTTTPDGYKVDENGAWIK